VNSKKYYNNSDPGI